MTLQNCIINDQNTSIATSRPLRLRVMLNPTAFSVFSRQTTAELVPQSIMALPFFTRRFCCLQAMLFVMAALRLACPAGTLQLVSVRDSGQTPAAAGGGNSYAPILSADGRFVLFASTANNLLLISNNVAVSLPNTALNVYLRDRANRAVKLVSMNFSGTGGGNSDSLPTGLSSDGRYALFESRASDLVRDDTNDAADIFVRDLVNGTTTLISVSTNGSAPNGASRGSVMTPDARYVVFVSQASNLVESDTNHIADLFLRDLQSGTTTLLTPGAMPIFPSFGGPESPDITPDGHYVAFYSTATNVVTGVTSPGEIYVRDIVGGTTIWASTNAQTIFQATFGPSSSIFSFNHAISADGKFVAFETSTKSPNPALAGGLILRFSLDTGLTDTVNTNAYFPKSVSYEEVRSLNITPDGRFIAFVANTNDSSGATTCIYLWDGQSQVSTLVSGDLTGNVPTNSTCDWPTVDPTGRFIAFVSSATNLVTNSLAGDYHIYRRDVPAGITTLIDADTNGTGSPITASTIPNMSSDGRFIAFESFDANLVPDDRNHAFDVFVRDLTTNAFDLISARDPALPSVTPNGPNTISPFALSGDGRWAAFSSDADDIGANDTNTVRDVFVRDLLLQTNLLVSPSINGASADGPSSEPAISSDGRHVAFTSLADNLVPRDTNGRQDVFVHDLLSGTTVMASVDPTGLASGNHESYSPALSPNGRFVLFRSRATNLSGDGVTGAENLFLRDLQLPITYALTTTGLAPASKSVFSPDGSLVAFITADGRLRLWSVQFTNITYSTNIGLAGSRLSISPDNRVVAFTESSPASLRALDPVANSISQISTAVAGGDRAGLRFSADGRFLVYAAAPTPLQSLQVFIYDFQTGTSNLISQSFDGVNPGSADSDFPVLSPDARFIVYRSSATNLVSGAQNNVPNIFQWDRTPSRTTLLTTGQDGAPANNRSFAPIFSANGATLLLPSAASDLVAYDFNQSSDLFSLAKALYVWVVGGPPGQGTTLAWFARPGENYRVQYKDSLSDTAWREATGSVTITSSMARLTENSPPSSQRFYRVVSY